MQLIVYIVSFPVLWLFSNLPMRILFVFSDLVFYLLYFVFGYRKKVVRKNLSLAFPDMSTNELRAIEKKSYRHFVDVFFEMIKSFTISEKEISKRLSITNPELLDSYFEKGQSVIFTSGHYANWEWVSFIVEKSLNYHMSVVYKKLKNKYFDNLMRKTRNKFGVRFVEKRNFYPEILKNKKDGIIQAYGFLADQSPKLKMAKYWDTFLNVEVPVEIGPETIARKMNYPVFYFQTEHVKRGVYKSTFLLLEEEPKNAEPNAITKRYLKALEDQIHKKPEFYFWTHKRFKHMGKKQGS
jgi:KDO2-lipid IV(A) lauroyltransferase